jgi:SDR family mycofactocin-dependent oxidoreductase
MGALDGKVVFITGAARAQGRSHAVRVASEGADVIAVDLCAAPMELGYPPPTIDDLEETARLVEKSGRRAVTAVVDVRDQASLDAALDRGAHELGRLDVVVANAGISSWGRFWEMPDELWLATLDVNLTGAWRTFRAAAPRLIEQGEGGSLIAISSVAGIKALPGQAHYTAAKHGLVGLVKAAAIELGPYGVRVNSVHPWGVDTPMAHDPAVHAMLEANPTYAGSFGSILTDPVLAEPEDISDAVVWLASDASRRVTGIQLPVDMGATTV